MQSLLPLWLLFAGLAMAAEPGVDLLGNFETTTPVRAAFHQSLSRGETLVMRWPGLIEADGTDVTVAYERMGNSGKYRQASGGDGRDSVSWARQVDSTLSSYRLQRKPNGGFVLEAVHRTPIPNGIRVRWTLIRDGSIVDQGELQAMRYDSKP